VFNADLVEYIQSDRSGELQQDWDEGKASGYTKRQKDNQTTKEAI
jgi:hypothetical protein